MANRKYQFRTREAAEQAAQHNADQRDLLGVAFNALLTDNVKWMDGKHGSADAYYRLGIIDRIAETVIVVAFYCPLTGQAPHAAAHHEEWLQEEIDRQTQLVTTDKERLAYREGLYSLRRFIHDNRRAWNAVA